MITYDGEVFKIGDLVTLKVEYLPDVPSEGTYEVIGIDTTHDELILSFNGTERLFHPFFVNKV